MSTPTLRSAPRGALFACLLLVGLAGCGEAPAPQPGAPKPLAGETASALDGVLAACLTKDPTNFLSQPAPGAVLLVDTPQGRYLKAGGLADLGSERALRVDDALQIGSNTKMFTGVLLLRLEERGLLTLDDLLSKWLPDLAAKIPHGDRMTLRQLATHTAGIWDYADAIIGGGLKDPALMRKAYAPRELVEYAIENGKPDFEPGAPGEWKYSNTGYILLGMVLERASGRHYAQLLQEHVFVPLDMRSAKLVKGSPSPEDPVHGYYGHAKAEATDVTSWNLSQGWAAGAIVCTAEDLARFGHALLDGSLFAKAQTSARMRDFVTGCVGLVNALCVGYGIGLQQLAPEAIGHRGQTLGFNSILMLFPEQRIVAVALTNDAEGPSVLVQVELHKLFVQEAPQGAPATVAK